MTISFNDLGNLGHLGNQMFQYAALKGVAAIRKDNCMIPPKELFGKNYPTKSMLDDCFTLECDRGISKFETFLEKTFSYDDEVFNLKSNNINLHGYFQSEKYFKHIESEIRKEFSFSEELMDECLGFIEDIDSDRELISIHIRRGDYVNLKSHHPTLPIEYYSESLKLLPDIPVLIFSDDPEWCLKQELFDSDRFLISDSNTPEFDMCLISLCKYHIIANSSFSWWGAWLSNSKNVIAPKKWFGPSLINNETKDLYCEDWKVI
jgi:hypothetical protein